MIDRQMLRDYADDYGLELDEIATEKLDTYAALLVEWNQRMNLTAITDPEGIVLKHFVDSLTLLPHLPKEPFSLVDVGTGAGFPGLPIAIVRDDVRLTLLDSLKKRLGFLGAVCEELAISAELVHARAEEAGQKEELRERFDVATARAVAALPTLCEYCLPFVRQGGCFLAMKGPDCEKELPVAKKAAEQLGGGTIEVQSLWLPARPTADRSERRILKISKISATPPKYPRPSAKIAKQSWR